MPRRPKKYHYIYKTTCKVTGKFYVGMHSTDNLDDGYLGSGKILGYSRQKYGDSAHEKVIVEMLPSREALKSREKEIVNEELLADPLNINLKYGGEGGWDHIDHEKARPARRAGMAKARAALLSDPLKKEKWKQIISKSTKATHASGKLVIPTFQGMQHTKETLQKMSASHKGKRSGEKNGKYGTCWVTNGNTSFQIKKDLLSEYIDKGYYLGRVITRRNHS